MDKKQKQKTSNESKAAALAKRQAKRRMEKQFVVLTFSREDLENYGFDTSEVDDRSMWFFVNELRKSIERVDLDDHVEIIAEEVADIPKHPEQPAA